MPVQSGQSFQAHWIQIEKRGPFFLLKIHAIWTRMCFFFIENLRYFNLTGMCFLKGKKTRHINRNVSIVTKFMYVYNMQYDGNPMKINRSLYFSPRNLNFHA